MADSTAATPAAASSNPPLATVPPRPMTAVDVDSIGNQALQAKNRRIKAEQDRQLLQNRINRLIVEEEKAAKRIAETRRRAKEIWELKRRNEASSATRQDAGAWMSAEQELQKELMRAARSERQAGVQASRGAMAHMRKEEVKVLRQMRAENEGACLLYTSPSPRDS